MKSRFCVLKPERVKIAYQYQKENNEWNFYQEREFIENLCQSRFNYLILLYSLFVGVFFQVDSKNKLVVLWLGAILTFLIGILLYRAYVKLIIILRILYELEDTLEGKSVFSIVDAEMKGKRWQTLFPVNSIMGIYVPLIMFLSFACGIITIGFDLWNP